MSTEAERVVVVVIQDASKEPSLSTIKWPLEQLSLKPGDKFILVGILHEIYNPMGFRTRVNASSMFGTNKKITDDELDKRKEHYQNNAEILKISQQCEKDQIKFRIKIIPGSPLKVVASRAARNFKATWLVLERHMKNDQRYFVKNLSCNIVRMNKDNMGEELRGPNTRDKYNSAAPRRSNVSYTDMFSVISPGGAQRPPKCSSVKSCSSVREGSENGGEHPQHSSRKSTSSRLASNSNSNSNSNCNTRAISLGYNEWKSSSSSHLHDDENTTTTGPGPGTTENSLEENLKQHNNPNDDWMGGNPADKVYENSICGVCKNRRPKIGWWMREFSYAELQAATEGFNAKHFLSEGGFGSVYRGEIKGMKIAVKQHKYTASLQGEKEFNSEVKVLGKARHENLVMLVGSCSEGNHRLLVYEYVCNGSLDLHLSKHTRRPLSWEKRVKIALGAAKGLKYLHDNNIIHRDMRPSNILVTHEFETLLGDFGLARTQHEDSDQSSETITRLVGTLGYLAPEYAECGKVSTKTDVYSFGVVLLQLITGMKTTDKRLGGKSLVGWARPLLKDRNYPDLIDPRIQDSHDVHQLFWMVRVAEKCLSKDPNKRFTMEKVVDLLDYIMGCDNICRIRDISPAQSDTVSRDSCESRSQSPCDDVNDDIDDDEEDDNSVFTIETTSASSLTQFSGRLPPSPPISRRSSAFNLFGESSVGVL